ncbi:hypothetical protein ACHWQZ_G000487 [Mnemiopsis leidyi]
MVSTEQILNKRKRVSKKNKKAWRKHTEIKDVEKFLEAKLREERTGGNPTDKKNKDLFYIDKSDLFQTPKSKLASMKCHSDLQIDTRVAPVVGRLGPSKRKKKKKKSQPQPDVAMTTESMSANRKTGSVYDIWGDDNQKQDQKELDPCLPPPVQPPAIYKTSDTKISAVELPHPGTSYNPTFTDHQDLLQTALEVEEKREKEKAKATRDAAPPIQITEEDYIKEMSIGLNQAESEGGSESESETEANEGEECRKSVTVRKTRVQRNREKAEKLKMEEAAALRENKQYLHQINRIKAIKKEIRKEEKKMETKTSARQEKKAINETRPGKYGPGKFMGSEPDFLLPEEVSSSLRKLVTPANNLQDRFTSLQKRNMLEVRKKVMPHRKYKLKHVEKWRKKLPEEIDELVKMKRKKKKIKLSE